MPTAIDPTRPTDLDDLTREEGWLVREPTFDPAKQHHSETIFTIGNGYLSTRGSLEEGYPSDHPATFIHGVFDEAPVVFTEIANTVNWLPIEVYADGERFSMHSGAILHHERTLDLRSGTLSRDVRWRSPAGKELTLRFERFTSLDARHSLRQSVFVLPHFDGEIQLRFALDANTDNEGLRHTSFLNQAISEGAAVLNVRTRQSGNQICAAMGVTPQPGSYPASSIATQWWDVPGRPTCVVSVQAQAGVGIAFTKDVLIATSRDEVELLLPGDPASAIRFSPTPEVAMRSALRAASQQTEAAQLAAWQAEWQRHNVIIEGDPEAQLSVRFNLFQLLCAAPRADDRVNIGAKTLSGFGYRGHAFWDTEIFMLPVFTYTAPHIAKNLLNYRHRNLPGARQKAAGNGYEGAQYPWESAATGEEVTPTWVPYHLDKTRLVRIWTGDIEIHISADIAYAAWQYWQATGDDAWMAAKGAEIILDTAKFWGSRAQWNAADGCYDIDDVIGPDEYHEHVDNNAYTNAMARWNLQTALDILDWLREKAPAQAGALCRDLEITPQRLDHWRDVIAKIYFHVLPGGRIEQFQGFDQREYIDLPSLEPRSRSVQEIYGIEGTNLTQVLKQPDVLMLQYILRDQFSHADVLANYEHYNPRTDHTYGSSLGPSIATIMACEVGKPDEAYEHFIRTARADLRDVRGNAGDGIHAASAGGSWQAIVFGFAGLRPQQDGSYTLAPRLPKHWQRLSFRICLQGKWHTVDIRE